MGTILKISEAAVIAVHAVNFLAKAEGSPSSTRLIASELGVSYNHLTKVLQRLTRAGLLVPGRGPKGGFLLSKKARAGKLRDVFEAMEGKMSLSNCLMKTKACGRPGCILGDLIPETNRKFREALDKKISELPARKTC
ncbi:MAG: Rrf2 family transcriptional regulator [Elusimicrobia bacterium]|nr:Rrf2 family transcriptional regulator [Elusimicrobiota bacterium]